MGWDTPHLHIKSSLYVWRRAYGSQIFKRNSIILICSRFIAFLRFWLLWLQGWFRTYKTFGDLSSLQLWGGGRWVWGHLGAWGGVSLDTYACICMHTHARNAKINMLGNCKWPPPWRQPCLSCLTCMHVCAHVSVCACMCMPTCVGGAPTQPHVPLKTHLPPRGVPPQISKNAIGLQ